jgi:hypothetical protein
MRIQLIDTQLALRNSTTRLPFRYGQACLTWCPQAILRARIALDAAVHVGYSGDCLPPGWFDKSPGKDFQRQIDEMLEAIELAGSVFGQRLARPAEFFPAWLEAQAEVHRLAAERQWPGLLASFGVSIVERAVIDAIARGLQLSFASLVHRNALRIDPAAVDADLQGHLPHDWLPAQPRKSVFVRHTVGLSDPLTTAEIPADERLHDGQPQALEEYIEQQGICYFKIKVRNDLPHDLPRLRTIAAVIQRHRGADYRVTLDGNEQYARAEDFDGLIEAIKSQPDLQPLWRNTLLIEQPLARDIALSAEHTAGIRRLSAEKPVMIDESDESLISYRQAIALGYRGVSSKNCKGPLKSLLNAGITWRLNQQAGGDARWPPYVMSGEDLCCVGVVPLQSDLCLVATLGLEHVERNGHHYHPGLAYLPADQQRAALEYHSDLYRQTEGRVHPAIHDGQLHIASLQCVGFGFACLPDFDRMTPATRSAGV